MRARGVPADFRATGQTGILIAGDGVPVDAVVADFISGAIERITPARHDDGWDLIEGQGSLFHPSFAGVSLGLLHGVAARGAGAVPRAGPPHMRGLPGRAMPGLAETLARNLEAARLTSATCARSASASTPRSWTPPRRGASATGPRTLLGLPCTDPMAFGVEAIIDNLLCVEASQRVTTASY